MLEVTRKDISFCMVGNGISALNLVLYIHEEILQGRLNIGGNRKMASLSLKNICKKYSNGFEAVKDFNLEIADKEFIIFVGPSGDRKSVV